MLEGAAATFTKVADARPSSDRDDIEASTKAVSAGKIGPDERAAPQKLCKKLFQECLTDAAVPASAPAALTQESARPMLLGHFFDVPGLIEAR